MFLGFVSAVRQNTWVDYAATTIAVLGVVTPSFVVALVLILVLSLGFQLLPTGGWGDSWQQAIMPVLAFSFGLIAIVARFTRSSVIEVLRSDFIRAARAKGLSQNAVLAPTRPPQRLDTGRHDRRSDVRGGDHRLVFHRDHLPYTGYRTVLHDQRLPARLPMIMALTLLYAALITVVYFLTDLVYAWIDPRVRVGAAEARSP